MKDVSDAIDGALDGFVRSLCADRRVAEELRASHREFFAPAPPAGRGGEARAAARRHLEWFLFERPSVALGGVPAEVAVHADPSLAGDADIEVLRALLDSPCGVFEVTSVRRGEGVWVRDLGAHGEYPLAEKGGSLALEPGDVIVGRLYPVGEASYRASPGAGCFRDPGLARAVAADLEAARGRGRGVLRLTQAELERLFWTPRAPVVEPGDAVERAREFLTRSGLSPKRARALLSELARSPFDPARLPVGGGDALGGVLERLAFDTDVDLERARGVLLAAWPALARNARSAARGPVDVRTAIEAFDAGRRAGQSLERLFDDLERDLDLAPDPGSATGEELAPDFPGVVGAMIEEYVWESERNGEAPADERDLLARFAAFGADIGVFENLGARELLAYATVWLPEFGRIARPGEARALLAALRRFCAWAERTQDVALLRAFDAELAGVPEALERLSAANAACAQPRVVGGEMFEVLATEGARATLRKPGAEASSARLDPRVAASLRAGDSLRGALGEDGVLAVYCCYPPQRSRLDTPRG